MIIRLLTRNTSDINATDNKHKSDACEIHNDYDTSNEDADTDNDTILTHSSVVLFNLPLSPIQDAARLLDETRRSVETLRGEFCSEL